MKMKKMIILGFLTMELLLASTYEVTNISCDEKLSVRIKPDVKSHAFNEMSCNKKGIKLIKCKASESKYQWCKISYKLYESVLTGWVYNKYIKETVLKKKVETSDEVKKLLKSAKSYYYGTKQVGQNYVKAHKIFLKASKKNSVVAHRYLGTMYLFGNGVDVDKKEAKKWLMLAIDLGDANAQKIYVTYFLHL